MLAGRDEIGQVGDRLAGAQQRSLQRTRVRGYLPAAAGTDRPGCLGRAPRLCHVGTAGGDQRFFQAWLGEAGQAVRWLKRALSERAQGDAMIEVKPSTCRVCSAYCPVVVTLEDGVVMYPNTAIIGRCHVKSNTIVSQGTALINRDTPGNAIAFRGEKAYSPRRRDPIRSGIVAGETPA